MKRIFLLNWGAFREETIFCFGNVSKKELIKYARELPARKDFIKDVREGFDTEGTSEGFVWRASRGSVIWIRGNTLDLETIGTIVHELHHAIYFLLIKAKGMADEPEAQAYTFEFLFNQVMKALGQ